MVTGFLARYPETSVDLRTGHVMIDLVQGGFDLAISPFATPDSTPGGTTSGGGTVYLVLRPGLPRKRSCAAMPRRPRLSQPPALRLRAIRETTGPSLILAAASGSRAFQET